MWSKTGSSSGPGFAWDLLFDPQDRSGPDRLQSQYLRVNVDPSERYVASFPGTSRYRLRAGDSGFDNLYLAGDWVRTSINAGCVEAAVMAGMDAAAAISGVPIPVVGGLARAPGSIRKKVAILGGGGAAMTAAYHLSSTPELRERPEVTVYQMGWRLGGKGRERARRRLCSTASRSTACTSGAASTTTLFA